MQGEEGPIFTYIKYKSKAKPSFSLPIPSVTDFGGSRGITIFKGRVLTYHARGCEVDSQAAYLRPLTG